MHVWFRISSCYSLAYARRVYAPDKGRRVTAERGKGPVAKMAQSGTAP